jgi:hypothetical protein
MQHRLHMASSLHQLYLLRFGYFPHAQVILYPRNFQFCISQAQFEIQRSSDLPFIASCRALRGYSRINQRIPHLVALPAPVRHPSFELRETCLQLPHLHYQVDRQYCSTDHETEYHHIPDHSFTFRMSSMDSPESVEIASATSRCSRLMVLSTSIVFR